MTTNTSSKNIMLRKKSNDIKQAFIILETVGQEIPLITSISVKLLDCPLGFKLDEAGKCECSTDLFDGHLKCDPPAIFTSYILRGFGIGLDPHINQSHETSDNIPSEKQYVVSHCINRYTASYSNYLSIEDWYYIH